MCVCGVGGCVDFFIARAIPQIQFPQLIRGFNLILTMLNGLGQGLILKLSWFLRAVKLLNLKEGGAHHEEPTKK